MKKKETILLDISKEGMPRFANRSYLSFIGVQSLSEVFSKPFHDVLSGSFSKELYQLYSLRITDGEQAYTRLKFKLEDGSSCWASVQMIPHHSENDLEGCTILIKPLKTKLYGKYLDLMSRWFKNRYNLIIWAERVAKTLVLAAVLFLFIWSL